MEVDVAHHQKAILILCRHCREPGHFVRDCPKTYNVHDMTLEEKETWIEQHLSATDITAVEAQSEASETLEILERLLESSLESLEEGFLSHNR
jgi:hypothetical protein